MTVLLISSFEELPPFARISGFAGKELTRGTRIPPPIFFVQLV
jgi:hypothetical protein